MNQSMGPTKITVILEKEGEEPTVIQFPLCELSPDFDGVSEMAHVMESVRAPTDYGLPQRLYFTPRLDSSIQPPKRVWCSMFASGHAVSDDAADLLRLIELKLDDGQPTPQTSTSS